jgi:hypothetical protein
MTALNSKHTEMGLTDGETLAFLIEQLRPSIRAVMCQAIAQKLCALDVCLTQVGQSISESSQFPSKMKILQELSDAQKLCEQIQQDLCSEAS